MRAVLILLLSLAASPVLACSFDTDCVPGSRCAKESGKLEGVCRSGINPGNSYDRQPATDPLDINKSHGNTCSFDTDCGPGSRCSKDRGAISGVCLKKGWTEETKSYQPKTYGRDTGGGECSWDSECGFGNRCDKDAGKIKGVCRAK